MQGLGRQGLCTSLPPLPVQVSLVAALLSPPLPRLLSFPGVTLLRWRRPCSRAGRAGLCAAGRVLGSKRSDDTLCLGLAARHLRDQSAERLRKICDGEQGQCLWG